MSKMKYPARSRVHVTVLVGLMIWPWWMTVAGLSAEQQEKAASEAPTEAEAKAGREADQSTPTQVDDEIEVTGRAADLVGRVGSATEGATSWVQFSRRPLLRPGELVETAPGVVATQHSGGGKGNQFFLRGFNLDHGTDFRVRVDGMPVNMPSHGHGQGYVDLNFLIPEVVSAVEYRKGPYHAESGDFSVAGGVDMELVNRLPRGLLEVRGGSNEYGRLLWAESFEAGGGVWTTAFDLFHENGPWTRGDDFDGYKAMLRYASGDAGRGWSVTLLAYDADWLSTDQVPLRALQSDQIGRFDLIDPGPRGSTERFSLSVQGQRGSASALTRWRAFAIAYDFDLISNFTYFLELPEIGDQFEQVDQRWISGGEVRHHWYGAWAGREVQVVAGGQVRRDDIDNGLLRTRELERVATVRRDEIRQTTAGSFAESVIHWSDAFRTEIGLRADWLGVDVNSDLFFNSGSEDDLLLSPNLSFVFGPWGGEGGGTEVYLNFGRGFHSNDARGATLRIDPATGEPAAAVDLLVPGEGVDLGVRTSLLSGWRTTLTAFVLELDSELVFVGDGGATEASRPSRRHGVEWTNFWRVDERWSFELDVTLTESEFLDDDPSGSEIPGAIGETVAASVTYDAKRWFGALRWRYFGDIPLVEDGSKVWNSSSLVNARLGRRITGRALRGLLSGELDLVFEIFNLIDSDDADVQYFYASRLPGEPLGGVEDIHLHPMPDRSFRLVASWRY